jgi:hypothetical protein
MRRRITLIVTLILVIILAGAALLLLNAPATTTVTIDTSTTDCPEKTEFGDCAQLPTVTGTNLKNESLTFPAALAGDYTLVVMPFDREQQARAIEYVPLFQTLAQDNEGVAYASIAALPDLSAPIRLLVTGGMNAAVTDDAIRAVTVILYLENQLGFIEALGVPDTEQIQVFIFNQSGQVLWRGAGDYSDAMADDIRAALAEIIPGE